MDIAEHLAERFRQSQASRVKYTNLMNRLITAVSSGDSDEIDSAQESIMEEASSGILPEEVEDRPAG